MRYRRKTFEVLAFQWKRDVNEIPSWFKANSHQYDIGPADILLIHTLAGTKLANPTDWVMMDDDRIETYDHNCFQILYEEIRK